MNTLAIVTTGLATDVDAVSVGCGDVRGHGDEARLRSLARLTPKPCLHTICS
jgi:hypothetical protein